MSGEAEDRGLQPERTSLAWQRTGLATIVLGLFILRLATLSGSPLLIVTACLMLAVAAASMVEGTRGAIGRRLRFEAAAPPSGSPRTAMSLAACTVGLALLGLAMTFRPLDGW